MTVVNLNLHRPDTFSSYIRMYIRSSTSISVAHDFPRLGETSTDPDTSHPHGNSLCKVHSTLKLIFPGMMFQDMEHLPPYLRSPATQAVAVITASRGARR